MRNSEILTIGIKTFCRPNTLKESLSILFTKNNQIYPVIIVDDSLNEYKKENLKIVNYFRQLYSADIKIIDMEFDSGLSKGRNLLVEHCKTKYIMILDDSRTFTNDTNISNMILFLENNPTYHLFCGVVNERPGRHRKYSGLFNNIKLIDGVINIDIFPSKPIYSTLFNDLEEVNIGLNVFIARTDTLRRVKWVNELKMGEHERFFYDFFMNGYKCVVSEDCIFTQVKNREYPEDLVKYRRRASTIESFVKLHWIKPDDKILLSITIFLVVVILFSVVQLIQV